jgi:hypothetical protein
MRIAALALVLLVLAPLRAEEAGDFASTWEGVWKGPCTVWRDGKVAMDFPMELHVAPIGEGRSGWTWRVVYGEGEKRQVRPYELLPVDGEPGHFVVDEKNGIVIDAYLERDALHSRFWVADNVIEATYAREGDAMVVALKTYGAKPVRLSGGEKGIPPVASYGLRAVQRATLER